MSKWKTVASQLELISDVTRETSEYIGVREGGSPLGSSRSRGNLYVIVEPEKGQPGQAEICRTIINRFTQVYFSDPSPSVTANLTTAMRAANETLADFNIGKDQRTALHLGLTAVALRGTEAFVAQILPGQLYIAHQGHLRAFPRFTEEQTPETSYLHYHPLGIDDQIDPDFYSSSLQAGDLIILIPSTVAGQLDRLTAEPLLIYQDGPGGRTQLIEFARKHEITDTYALVVEILGSFAETPATTSGQPKGKLNKQASLLIGGLREFVSGTKARFSKQPPADIEEQQYGSSAVGLRRPPQLTPRTEDTEMSTPVDDLFSEPELVEDTEIRSNVIDLHSIRQARAKNEVQENPNISHVDRSIDLDPAVSAQIDARAAVGDYYGSSGFYTARQGGGGNEPVDNNEQPGTHANPPTGQAYPRDPDASRPAGNQSYAQRLPHPPSSHQADDDITEALPFIEPGTLSGNWGDLSGRQNTGADEQAEPSYVRRPIPGKPQGSEIDPALFAELFGPDTVENESPSPVRTTGSLDAPFIPPEYDDDEYEPSGRRSVGERFSGFFRRILPQRGKNPQTDSFSSITNDPEEGEFDHYAPSTFSRTQPHGENDFAPGEDTYYPEDEPAPRARPWSQLSAISPRTKRNALIAAGAIIVVVLIVAIGSYVVIKGRTSDNRYNNFITQAQQAQSAAIQASDNATRRADLMTAKDDLAQAAALDPVKAKTAEYQNLAAQIQNDLDTLNGIVRLQPRIVADFTATGVLSTSGSLNSILAQGDAFYAIDDTGSHIVGFTAKSGQMQAILKQGDKVGTTTVGKLIDVLTREGQLVAIDANYMTYQYDATTGTWQPLINTKIGQPPNGWGGAIKFSLYSGTDAVYLLTGGTNGRIWRWTNGHLNETPSSWIDQGSLPEIIDPVGFFIDGDIWILLKNGRILHMSQGKTVPNGSLPLSLDPPLALNGPTRITGTLDDSKSIGEIFIADPLHQRIVRMTKDGRNIQQLVAPDGSDATSAVRDISISDDGHTFSWINGHILYSATLPPNTGTNQVNPTTNKPTSPSSGTGSGTPQPVATMVP